MFANDKPSDVNGRNETKRFLFLFPFILLQLFASSNELMFFFQFHSFSQLVRLVFVQSIFTHHHSSSSYYWLVECHTLWILYVYVYIYGQCVFFFCYSIRIRISFELHIEIQWNKSDFFFRFKKRNEFHNWNGVSNKTIKIEREMRPHTMW